MLLIGQVAEQSGLATSAIRYYEDLGLIETATRVSGRRHFPESTPRRLRAITAAREAGFTLEEIQRLLDSQAEGTQEWIELVEAKLGEIRSRLRRLRGIEKTLRDSLTCGCQAWDECPILLS